MSFAGITTALVTPFRGGKLCEEGLRENIRFQIGEEIDALLFLGSTGEGNLLSEEERERVMEIAIDEGKDRVPLLFSCGDPSTTRAMRYLQAAEKMGAEGALVSAPYYCRPTQEGLFCHFEALANSTSLPIILYNNPARVGVEIQEETVRRLAKIDTIIGIKDASGSMSYGASLIGALPDFLVLAGDDVMALPLLSIGGDGLISTLSNLMPRKMKQLVSTRDVNLFQSLYPWIALSQIETNPVPIKTMMNLAGLAAGECRMPLAPLSEVNERKVRELFLQPSGYR